MLRDALTITEKDLRIEVRSKVLLSQVFPVIAGLFLIFGFAFGPFKQQLSQVAPGLIWITVMISSLFVAQRSFAIEVQDEARDNLRLLGTDAASVFLGKMFSQFVELLAVELISILGAVLILSATLPTGIQLIYLVVECILVALSLGSAATIYGAMSFFSSTRETLMPLLLIPASAPVLLASSKLTSGMLGPTNVDDPLWTGILLICAITYLTLGVVAFESMLEDT